MEMISLEEAICGVQGEIYALQNLVKSAIAASLIDKGKSDIQRVYDVLLDIRNIDLRNSVSQETTDVEFDAFANAYQDIFDSALEVVRVGSAASSAESEH